jgi:cytochrome c oxidase cbb3-type subunit 3
MWLLVWMRKRRDAATTTPPGTSGTATCASTTTPCRAGGCGCSSSVIFSIGYLVLYPGMGNVQGHARLDAAEAVGRDAGRAGEEGAGHARAVCRQAYRRAVARSGRTEVGRNLFANNCSTCHGSDGGGAAGFPNSPTGTGSGAATPRPSYHDPRRPHRCDARGKTCSGKRVSTNVVAHVLSLSGRAGRNRRRCRGQGRNSSCSARPATARTASGQTALGAPNLTDKIWLHGGSQETIRRVIAQGRNNAMPAHGDRLGDERVKLLTAYVMSLGESDVAGSGTLKLDADADETAQQELGRGRVFFTVVPGAASSRVGGDDAVLRVRRPGAVRRRREPNR